LEYLNLSEIAYLKIKEAILKHEIVPGQKLYHQDLVRRLKFSQTPIREALSRLMQEGYVTRLANKGYRVSEMTSEEVTELFGLREALEFYCLAQTIERITPNAVKRLDENVKLYKKALASNAPLIDRYIINKSFHMMIAGFARNDLVYRLLDDACEKLILKRRIEDVSQGGFKVLRHHGEIVEAIKQKDVGKAQQITNLHLNGIKNYLIEQIEKREKASVAL